MRYRPVILAAALAVAFFCLPSFAESAPFSRGVNLTRWFEASSPRTIQFTKFTLADFENIKSLGADVIRLPINLHAMTGGKPDYALDPLFLGFLDQAVDMAEKTGLHIILDNHSFDPIVPTDPDIERILLAVWPQMAAHFKDRSDLVMYEILNEPHGIDPEKWGRVQGNVIDAIRKVDARHAIVVGAANYNNIPDLKKLPRYADSNLIYTFHFYDPMVFTHQGADFTSPSLKDLRGVPWPPAAGAVPVVSASLKGSWVENTLKYYAKDGSPDKMESTLAEAAKFASDRGVRVFCGEFGVLKTVAGDADRIRWYREVREWLEKNGIPWTSWDYYGSFGPFKTLSGGRFDADLNVPLIEALGFTAPPQIARTQAPETAGFTVYDDYAAPGILMDGWQKGGALDCYSTKTVASGKYSILWKDAARYDSFVFDFPGSRDLSALLRDGYALELIMRMSGGLARFDIRFMNPDDLASDLPWRMVKTIDSSVVPADGEWHRVRIPLSSMVDSGAWKQSSQKWFGPSGKFSWSSVVSLQFAAEEQALAGCEIGFDDIRIAK